MARLRLATDSLVLVLASDASRSATGVRAMHLGRINDAGRVSLLLAGGDVPLEYDALVQTVLPWSAAGAPGWDEAALVHDAEELPALADTASRLLTNAQGLRASSTSCVPPQFKELLNELRREADSMFDAMGENRLLVAQAEAEANADTRASHPPSSKRKPLAERRKIAFKL